MFVSSVAPKNPCARGNEGIECDANNTDTTIPIDEQWVSDHHTHTHLDYEDHKHTHTCIVTDCLCLQNWCRRPSRVLPGPARGRCYDNYPTGFHREEFILWPQNLCCLALLTLRSRCASVCVNDWVSDYMNMCVCLYVYWIVWLSLTANVTHVLFPLQKNDLFALQKRTSSYPVFLSCLPVQISKHS